MADIDDIRHLLRRTEFVARPGRVAELVGGSFEAAVDDVLAVPTTPVPIPDGFTTRDPSAVPAQSVQAQHWWYDRMVHGSSRPIQEKMAVFWHGHFCSDWGRVDDPKAMMDQNALFRDQGLGNLRTLAQAMAIQPAMLRYLDNADSRKDSPNQNFARELLELFLLGVGNYTEADVEAATAAWTGYNLNWTTGAFVLRETHHDDSVKTFLGRTGRWRGPDIIDIVLGPDAVIAVGPNAGRRARDVAAGFLSRKLWEAFAAGSPSASVVDALASVLVASDFEIKPWVRAMLVHPEFRSAAVRTGLVKTPTEYIVTLLYESNLPVAVTHPEWYAGDMGQALFAPPDVSGWKTNGYWVNAGALAARAGYADYVRWRLLDGRQTGGSLRLRAGTWSWSQLDAMTSEQLVDTLAAAFEVPLSAATRAKVVAWARGEDFGSWIGWWRSANALLLMMIVPEMGVA